jgi:hypothetical protein
VAGFDIAGARRWGRRFASTRTLARRADAELPFVSEEALAGEPLMLDTCVYIDQLQGKAPPLLEKLIETRHVQHSTVAIQELMHAIGVLDPGDPRTAKAVPAIAGQIEAMPDHRTFAPDVDVLGRAALLCGMLCRRQGHAKDDRLKALHDCTLFLQAQKLGCTVLTANVAEFDILLQLVPAARMLFYRAQA